MHRGQFMNFLWVSTHYRVLIMLGRDLVLQKKRLVVTPISILQRSF